MQVALLALGHSQVRKGPSRWGPWLRQRVGGTCCPWPEAKASEAE